MSKFTQEELREIVEELKPINSTSEILSNPESIEDLMEKLTAVKDIYNTALKNLQEKHPEFYKIVIEKSRNAE